MYRWRSLPRVRRHRASKPQGSSERVLPWQVTMDQLVCASLSRTHYWYEVGMLKVSEHVRYRQQYRTAVYKRARGMVGSQNHLHLFVSLLLFVFLFVYFFVFLLCVPSWLHLHIPFLLSAFPLVFFKSDRVPGLVWFGLDPFIL